MCLGREVCGIRIETNAARLSHFPVTHRKHACETAETRSA